MQTYSNVYNIKTTHTPGSSLTILIAAISELLMFLAWKKMHNITRWTGKSDRTLSFMKIWIIKCIILTVKSEEPFQLL